MNYQVNEITVHAKPVKCLKIIGNPIQSRNPAHTIILLDTSGSMDEGSKLRNVKKSLTFLLKFLHKTDYLSLVNFNDTSQILIENINVTNEYMEAFRYTIDTLTAQNGTNLSAGLLNVKGILERNVSNIKTGLIILTDGHANEGLTRSEDLLRIIQSIKTLNPSISITTIGYNDDHNANLLKEIAVNGNGSYNIVNNIEQVATVFGDILGGLITTVAQNVTVSYPSSWNNLNIYKKTVNGNITTLNIGDVCGESETILLFKDADTSSITVSGVNTDTLESIHNTITWAASQSEYNAYKDSYMMAYIRNSLAYILSNMKTINKEDTKNSLNEMKEFLNGPLIQFNPLTRMLKEEILSIENQLNNSCIDTNHNLQTSMMLGFGRGMSSARPPMRRRHSIVNNIDNITDALNDVNIRTPFANRVQLDITQQMYSMTEDDPCQ